VQLSRLLSPIPLLVWDVLKVRAVVEMDQRVTKPGSDYCSEICAAEKAFS